MQNDKRAKRSIYDLMNYQEGCKPKKKLKVNLLQQQDMTENELKMQNFEQQKNKEFLSKKGINNYNKSVAKITFDTLIQSKCQKYLKRANNQNEQSRSKSKDFIEKQKKTAEKKEFEFEKIDFNNLGKDYHKLAKQKIDSSNNQRSSELKYSIDSKQRPSKKQKNQKKTNSFEVIELNKKSNDKKIKKDKVIKIVQQNTKGLSVTKGVQSVPIDLYFSQKQNYKVFQLGKSFYSVTLSQSNLSRDDNKFYIVQILQSKVNNQQFYLYTRWGRVGVIGQINEKGPLGRGQAIRQYHQKINEKIKIGGYVIVDVSYDKGQDYDSGEIDQYLKNQNSSLDQPTQQLVRLIFDFKMMNSYMKQVGYDQKRSPLGLIAKSSIDKGYMALDIILKVIKNEGLASTESQKRKMLNKYSSDFYSAIPHDFGYMNMQAFVINTEEKVKQKLDMLSSLSQIQIYANLMKEKSNDLGLCDLDFKYSKLKCQISSINPQQQIYSIIMKYIKNSHGKTHDKWSIDVINLFKLRRAEEQINYRKDLPNKMLLWHGSRLTNYVGILSEGLKIAPYEAPVTGYMFGKGIYFADAVSKSANYCLPKRDSVALMLLCEVALGETYDKFSADYSAHDLPPHKNSTRGVGKYAPSDGQYMDDVWVPNGVMVPTSIQETKLTYNQYVVYNRDQIRCRYIVYFRYNFL